MPEQLERHLTLKVNREHPNWSEKRKAAYVYGTMRKMGWKPERER